MGNIQIVGLDNLKRTFLKQNWRGSKIKSKMRSAMRLGGKRFRTDARNTVKSAPGVKTSTLRTAAKAWGWKNYAEGNGFGLKLTPRAGTGKYFTDGSYSKNGKKGPLDLAYLVNVWGKKINLSNRVNTQRGADDMLKAQADFIEKLWSKGQL